MTDERADLAPEDTRVLPDDVRTSAPDGDVIDDPEPEDDPEVTEEIPQP